jgi:hypothetical protein
MNKVSKVNKLIAKAYLSNLMSYRHKKMGNSEQYSMTHDPATDKPGDTYVEWLEKQYEAKGSL